MNKVKIKKTGASDLSILILITRQRRDKTAGEGEERG